MSFLTISPTVLPTINSIVRTAEKQLSEIAGCRVSLTMAVDVVSVPSTREANLLRLQELICFHFNVDWNDLKDSKRKSAVVDARQAYSYLARRLFNRAYQKIGDDLCRDHSTIVKSIQAMNDKMDVQDRKVAPIVNKILNQIQAENQTAL